MVVIDSHLSSPGPRTLLGLMSYHSYHMLLKYMVKELIMIF